MIRVEMTAERFSVRGHASSGSKGEDLVCSAVTALANAYVFSLKEVLGIDVQVDRWQAGEIQTAWKASDLTETARTVVRCFQESFIELAKNHEDFLEVGAGDDMMID